MANTNGEQSNDDLSDIFDGQYASKVDDDLTDLTDLPTDHIEYRVTITVPIYWTRDDVQSDEEWVELRTKMSKLTDDEVLEVLSSTYEKTSDLVESMKEFGQTKVEGVWQ